jgi:hypothetical protein
MPSRCLADSGSGRADTERSLPGAGWRNAQFDRSSRLKDRSPIGGAQKDEQSAQADLQLIHLMDELDWGLPKEPTLSPLPLGSVASDAEDSRPHGKRLTTF